MRVRDVMKHEPCTARPGSTLAEVGRLMAEAGCGFLPVVGEEERVVGVITDRDLALATATRDTRPSEVAVREVMGEEVWSCRPDDDVRRALGEMRQHKVRRLAVLDDAGTLVGILSLDDVVLEAQAVETTAFKGPFYSDITQTLKAINFHPVPALRASAPRAERWRGARPPGWPLPAATRRRGGPPWSVRSRRAVPPCPGCA